MLPSRWQTERLSIRDSVLDELPELEAVVAACSYIHEWTGYRPEDHPGDSLRSALTDGELPPNGSKEFHRMQSIRLRDKGHLIGYLAAYHGWPTAGSFFITYLMIGPQFQGQGYGTELTRAWSDLVLQLGAYTRMRLLAALKNWPALRFWIRAGFDRIVDYRGDERHSPETFAYLMLEKLLPSRG
jgi:ribosomal protein S18 acetylase RimI-like enzyme